MSASVRPIHLPGASALSSLRERALPALDAWARDWVMGWRGAGTRSVPLIVSSVERSVALESVKYEAVRGGADKLWIRSTDADRRSFGQAVVGRELMSRLTGIDDWIAGVVDHAWRARSKALFASLFGAPPAQFGQEQLGVPEAAAFGSGAVLLSCETIGLLAIADGNVWNKSAPAARREPLPKLTMLDRAVKSSVLRLEVTLGSVPLEVPKLLDLRVGDVLRLPQRLDQPLEVTCNRLPLAHALLGESGGRRGVQLIAQSRNSNYTEPSHDSDRK